MVYGILELINFAHSEIYDQAFIGLVMIFCGCHYKHGRFLSFSNRKRSHINL